MRVAAVQVNASEDIRDNLDRVDRLTRAAAAEGATLVVLPEKWTAMGPDESLRRAAQGLDGEAIAWARETARELAIDLVAGSIVERIDPERLANTSVHVDATGTVRGVYRKIHMFDVEIEGRVYRESDLEQAGGEIVLSATTSGVTLGMSICYDLRFPEIYRILAVGGATVMVVPAAFTLATTRDHWEVLLRARAIENQAYVIAANQTGSHPGGGRSGGRSMIVDPWGVVRAQAGDREGCVVAEIDLDYLRDVRERLPALANRRPDAYAWPEAERV